MYFTLPSTCREACEGRNVMFLVKPSFWGLIKTSTVTFILIGPELFQSAFQFSRSHRKNTRWHRFPKHSNPSGIPYTALSFTLSPEIPNRHGGNSMVQPQFCLQFHNSEALQLAWAGNQLSWILDCRGTPQCDWVITFDLFWPHFLNKLIERSLIYHHDR